MAIRSCPSCGRRRVERKRTTLALKVRGRAYQIEDVELEICPDCGEILLDLEASRKVEEVVYRRQKHPKRTAA